MARIKVGVTAHARHKKILKMAKGYRGTRSRLFKKANESVMKALYYARRDRRAKKREFRKLWIARINAATRANGRAYRAARHCVQGERHAPLQSRKGWNNTCRAATQGELLQGRVRGT